MSKSIESSKCEEGSIGSILKLERSEYMKKMNKDEAYETLLKSFAVLDEKEVENFRFHLKNETPVFCGEGSSVKFHDEKYRIRLTCLPS